MEGKMINAILDIHAHKQEAGFECKSIINYWLSEGSSFQEGCYYSVGIHPWKLTVANFDQQLDFLIERLPDKRVVAIGEAGLDRLTDTSMALQTLAFVMQIQLSETYGLPLIIHCVKAMDQLLAAKKQFEPKQPWIWHGFRGKPEQAAQLLKQGFYLSLGEHYPDETMKLIPDDRLFLETDESSLDIEEILCRAAEVRGVEAEVLRETVCGNIQNVFFKA
ncbi:TatD family hydrolase [Bacteroides sp. f07]|uniref:TatD family hydrolase n=1 Tax=Bacteroides sp. f07 TaxID=3132704 RepID=UPI0034B92FC3